MGAVTLALVLLAGVGAGSAQAEGATVSVEFSCSGVTYHFEGFPNANNNAITETVYVDGTPTYRKFRFNGPAGTNFFALPVPPGHHTYDARAKWKTNGVKGGRDIKDPSGITCQADPAYTIEKLQKIGGAYTTETLPSAHVGQTVNYKIVVTNTGNVPLTFSPLSDPKCEGISGGPGAKPLAAGEQTVFLCHHPLSAADGEAGEYCNVATATAEYESSSITKESNTVCVELPQKSGFSQQASCKSVTFFFFGFPKTTGNTVTEVVYVDGTVFYKANFTFDGSSGSNTVTLNLPPGHHTLDVRAKWNTNGVRGGADHKIAGGVNCVPE